MRIILILAFVISSVTASAQPLVIGYSESDHEPYYFFQDGKLVGGFFFDLGQALGKKLGVPVSYRAYPRNRIEDALARGEITAIPFENPGWMAAPQRFLWSKPFLIDRTQVLYQKAKLPPVTSPANLRGLRIGTILGYYYPTLDADFAAGHFFRDDARTFQQNLAKLLAGRIDALIASEHELDWVVGVTTDTLQRGPWLVDSTPVSLAASMESQEASEKLTEALDILTNEGAVQNLWTKYRK